MVMISKYSRSCPSRTLSMKQHGQSWATARRVICHLWSSAGKGVTESLCNSVPHARWESLPPSSPFWVCPCSFLKFYYTSASVCDMNRYIARVEARELLVGIGSLPLRMDSHTQVGLKAWQQAPSPLSQLSSPIYQLLGMTWDHLPWPTSLCSKSNKFAYATPERR